MAANSPTWAGQGGILVQSWNRALSHPACGHIPNRPATSVLITEILGGLAVLNRSGGRTDRPALRCSLDGCCTCPKSFLPPQAIHKKYSFSISVCAMVCLATLALVWFLFNLPETVFFTTLLSCQSLCSILSRYQTRRLVMESLCINLCATHSYGITLLLTFYLVCFKL